MRRLLLIPLAIAAPLAGAATRLVQDQCGPFTDVSPLYCPYVLGAYYTGITAGTSATTFSPDLPITRGQAAVFATKGLNQALARGSRRAALGQWWTTQNGFAMPGTPVAFPGGVRSDGADLWVASYLDNSVTRVRASDGKVLETWTNLDFASDVLPAMGRVFVSKYADPGALYMIDPTQPPGTAVTVADLPAFPGALAFDGSRIWTANRSSVSMITPGPTIPWSVATASQGFTSVDNMVFDGANIWVGDEAGVLLKLDSNGAVLQTVPVGPAPAGLAFDGANIWVPLLHGDAVAVVRAETGSVLTTLTGNGLHLPNSAAFDGQRVMVANSQTISLWRAADLTPIGFFSTETHANPLAVCSDGLNFWISMAGSNELVRY